VCDKYARVKVWPVSTVRAVTHQLTKSTGRDNLITVPIRYKEIQSHTSYMKSCGVHSFHGQPGDQWFPLQIRDKLQIKDTPDRLWNDETNFSCVVKPNTVKWLHK